MLEKIDTDELTRLTREMLGKGEEKGEEKDFSPRFYSYVIFCTICPGSTMNSVRT